MIYQGKAIQVRYVDNDYVEFKFNLEGETVNKFNSLTLSELSQALEAVSQESRVRGMLMCSGKEVFIVGADITEFGNWFPKPGGDPAKFRERVAEAHRMFSSIEDLPFPTIAMINGVALGGGFEIALACDFRVMSNIAKIGLPEVKLGIFPGWGGTVRLPRVIGLNDAIDWIASGKTHGADHALSVGAVNVAVAPEALRGAAIGLLDRVNQGELDYQETRIKKINPIELKENERIEIFSTNKQVLQNKLGSHYPAPLMALEVMEKHTLLSRDQALVVETEAFINVVQTETARNLVGLFLNDQYLKRQARDYEKSASKVKSAAVLGAGIMGGGIAYQAALRGTPIIMKDINEQAIDLGINQAKKLLNKRIERGSMSEEQADEVLKRINPTLSYNDVIKTDIVIEAVIENPKIKHEVLSELEQLVDDQAIIASNTSTISIDELSTALSKPERFCGMHFFNPVHVMPLVEVIRGARSSEQTIATTVNFARTMGKNPIVVNNCPGFLVNRILFPYFTGFDLLLRDGADFRQVDRVMEEFGWPMGPAYLLDVVGIDTAHHAAAIVADAYPDRMRLDFKSVTTLMYENERLGQKSGSGYYKYEIDTKGKPKKSFDENALDIITQVQKQPSEFDDAEIVERMMIPMCLETVRCLEDGIVDSPSAADMGLIWGLGFPTFRGGPLRYIDSIGAKAFCAMAKKYEFLGGAYQATDGLRRMAETDEQYF